MDNGLSRRWAVVVFFGAMLGLPACKSATVAPVADAQKKVVNALPRAEGNESPGLTPLQEVQRERSLDVSDDSVRIWISFCPRQTNDMASVDDDDARACRSHEVGSQLVALGYRVEFGPVHYTVHQFIPDFGGMGPAARIVRVDTSRRQIERSNFLVLQAFPIMEGTRDDERDINIRAGAHSLAGKFFDSAANAQARERHRGLLEQALKGQGDDAIATLKTELVALGVSGSSIADLEGAVTANLTFPDGNDDKRAFGHLSRAILAFVHRDMVAVVGHCQKTLALTESIPFSRQLLARAFAVLQFYSRSVALGRQRVAELDAAKLSRPLTSDETEDLLRSLVLVGGVATDGAAHHDVETLEAGILAYERLSRFNISNDVSDAIERNLPQLKLHLEAANAEDAAHARQIAKR